MAIKQKPLGQGMVKGPAGDWTHTPNLPKPKSIPDSPDMLAPAP